jgi:hypothetical protein
MGREARCGCRWGERRGNVTALLESSEFIVRGDFRARAALAAIEEVGVRDERLEFRVAGERVALELDNARARRWAQAIVAQPPTLARKLGIGAHTRLHLRGTVDDDALAAALADAAASDAPLGEADLAIVRTDDGDVLARWTGEIASESRDPVIWVVYVKGRSAPLGETAVRESLRRSGFIDVKTAAVSERLSALKFTKRRPALNDTT